MPNRPPVEKLPLAARKSFRDDFEAKRSGLETALSEVFGTEWKIEVDPNALYAYANDDNKSSPGAATADYFVKAIDKIKEFQNRYGASGVAAVNRQAAKHILTLKEDDSTSYSSCVIRDGALVIIFHANNFGSWVSGALGDLPEALDKAESSAEGPYSFIARAGIEEEYDPKIEAVQKQFAEILAIPDVKLNPRLEENAKAMTDAKVHDWKGSFGRNMIKTMKDAAQGLEDAGFKGDDMMQEALQEALTAKEIGVYLVAEEAKGKWNAVALKDGVIQLQFDSDYFGTSITSNMKTLIDVL